MNEKKSLSVKRPVIFFLSFFGVGFSPKAPGTMGTLAIMPVLYFLAQLRPPFVLFLPFILITTILSCYLAHHIETEYDLHDPQWIVIDEVLGMSVAWLFIKDPGLLHHLTLFILFRFFDIVKIWPASYFDKLKHGSGIIIDDLVSGVYAGLVYATLFHFGLFSF